MDSKATPPRPVDTGKTYQNEFATTDAAGKPVKFRFQNASSLVSVYKKLQDADLKEADRRSRIRKAYDCYKPFDAMKLKAKGLGNLTNVNFGELAGQIDARSTALQDLALDTTNLVELRALAADKAGPDASDIGDIVAQEFSVTLRESREFLPALTTCVREADLYGLGPVTWTDCWDYQPVALERGQLKFMDDASSVSSKNELYMIDGTLPNWYLFGLFDDPEQSKAAGWDLKTVRQYIVDVFARGTDTVSQAGDFAGTSVQESAIALWRQNRMFETNQFEVVRVIHAFVREVSGGRKITHYIVPASGSPDGFLFAKYEAYENMDQCMVWLPANVAERYARGARGIASKLLPVADLNNRFLCQIFDFAFRDATFKMKSGSAGSVKADIVEHGPFTIYGSSLEGVQNQSSANIQQLAGLRQLAQGAAYNAATGMSGPAAQPETTFKGNTRRTKDEVALEGAAGERMEQSMFVLRLTVFDTIFRECFRRFMNLVNGDELMRDRYPGVTDFIERCDRRGVDAKRLRQVPKLFKAYMCRDLVTGGAGAKASMLTEVLTTLGGNLDEQGRLSGTRDVMIYRFGQKAADRYRPAVGRDATPSDAASHATLENNDMRELAQVMAAPDQLHWAHIPVHLRDFGALIQSAQQGQFDDAQRVLDTLEIQSAHIAEHVSFGGRQIGKEADAKAVMAQLRSVRPVIQQLTVQAAAQEKHQEALQKQQEEQMAELQKKAEGQDAAVEMHKTDVKGQLAMREQDLLHQARMAGVGHKAQTDLLKTQQKAEIDRMTANTARYVKAQSILGNPPPDVSAEEPGGMF
jgi:hypothetical protein